MTKENLPAISWGPPPLALAAPRLSLSFQVHGATRTAARIFPFPLARKSSISGLAWTLSLAQSSKTARNPSTISTSTTLKQRGLAQQESRALIEKPKPWRERGLPNSRKTHQEQDPPRLTATSEASCP